MMAEGAPMADVSFDLEHSTTFQLREAQLSRNVPNLFPDTCTPVPCAMCPEIWKNEYTFCMEETSQVTLKMEVKN